MLGLGLGDDGGGGGGAETITRVDDDGGGETTGTVDDVKEVDVSMIAGAVLVKVVEELVSTIGAGVLVNGIVA